MEAEAVETRMGLNLGRPAYVQTDAGRAQSRRPKQKRDCVVRAIATAFMRRYDEVYDLMAGAGRKCGRGTPKVAWKAVLKRCGERVAFPATAGQPRVNVVTFCRDHGREGRWVVQTAGHLFAVVDGVPHDDVAPRWNACVYAAWRATKDLK